MRLLSVRLGGLTTFKTAQALDLEDAGEVVAIVGDNGAGKTTLLEAPFAALYRRWASRDGNVADEAVGQAHIEAVFAADTGERYTARLSIDPGRRKVEQHLLCNGVPLTSGKRDDVLEQVVKLFGSKELVLASAVAAQTRAGDFTTLGRGERKALFGEALGLTRLETLAKAGRDRLAQARMVSASAAAAAAATEAEAKRLESARAALAAAQQAELEAQAGVESARQAHAAAAEDLEKARAYDQGMQAAQRAVADADAAVSSARAALRLLEAKNNQARQLVEQTRRTLVAVTTKAQERLDWELQVPEVCDVAQPRQALQEAETALAAAAAASKRHGADYNAARSAQERLQRLEGDARATLASAKERDAAHEASLKGWRRQAELLGEVPCHGTDLEASCKLLGSAREARDRAAQPHASDVERLQQALVEAQQAAAEAETAVSTRRTAAEAIAAEHNRLGVLVAEGKAALERAERLAADRARIEEARARLLVDLERDRARLADLNRGAQATEEQHAEAMAIAQREQQAVEEDRTQRERLRAKLAQSQPPVGVLTAAAGRAAENLRQAQDRHSACAREVGAKDNAVAELAVKVDQLPELVEVSRRANDDEADWETLAQALGRDGIQALEIDAAGPDVAGLCNELLASCYGPRFSLRFETLRQNQTNDGAQEVFEVKVFDDGAERLLDKLSGGEKVIIREAVALALAIWNARRSGVKWRTLFRDETAGALSVPNAIAYVAMLRRALALGGFAQVVFVSHQPEVSARADTIVRVVASPEGSSIAA